MMEKLKKIPDFKDDQELAAFMEKHDGFELVDQGLAEIVETPERHAHRAAERSDVDPLVLLHPPAGRGRPRPPVAEP